jgi:hypothetical protein
MSRGDYYPSLDGNHGMVDEGGSSRRMGDVVVVETRTGTGTGGGSSASHIVTIRSSNIAGMIGEGYDGGGRGGEEKEEEDGGTMDRGTTSSEIRIDFGNEACFVAVTGER